MKRDLVNALLPSAEQSGTPRRIVLPQGAALDPYLVWAVRTGFAGFVIDGDVDPQLHVAVAQHNGRGGFSAFATQWMRLSELPSAVQDPARRIELGMAAKTAGIGLAAPAPKRRRAAARAPARLQGPVIAIIDDGCAFAHQNFRSVQRGRWRSRIAYLWDQDERAAPRPLWRDDGVAYGQELRNVAGQYAIDALIGRHCRKGSLFVDEDACYRECGYDRVGFDRVHGTHVMDLACGRDPRDSRETDTADKAQLIFVQLPRTTVADTSGGSMSVYVVDALRYNGERVDDDADVVVNLSYGSMAGPHDGSTMLERAMAEFILQARRKRLFEVVLPAGNGLLSQEHAQLTLSADAPVQTLHWQVMPDDPTESYVELWFNGRPHGMRISVTAPDGREIVAVGADEVAVLSDAPKDPVCAVVHLAQGLCTPDRSMALIALAPSRASAPRSSAPHGIWSITVACDAPPARAVLIDAWVERDDVLLNDLSGLRQSRFVPARRPDVDADDPQDPVKMLGTGSSIAHGEETRVVGGCFETVSGLVRYTAAAPSADGRSRRHTPWPDVVAPADGDWALDGILGAGTRSGVTWRMNGTSAAAPLVTRQLINAGRFRLAGRFAQRLPTHRIADAGPLDAARGAARSVTP